MPFKIFTFLLLTVLFILSGCNVLSQEAPPPDGQGQTTASTAVIEPATVTSAPTATVAAATSTQTVLPDPTREPTEVPEITPVPYAGLFYGDNEGLWLINTDGHPAFLIDRSDGALSPDGSMIIYADGEPADIWLVDLRSGERKNLTNTEGRTESSPQWWPGRPELVMFASIFADEPLFGYGRPTVVSLDGTGYRVLDEKRDGPVAFSPDGQVVAFGCCGATGNLYDLTEGAKVFDPASYGAPVEKLYKPEWSPEGDEIAWKVGGPLSGDNQWQIGVAVFDLTAETFRLLHPYAPMGGSAVDPVLSWGPDGNWLAFVTHAETAEQGRGPGLWILRTDGQEEIHLGTGDAPIWRPDGGWLAFNQTDDVTGAPTIWIVETENWENRVMLPFNGRLQGWIPTGQR